VHAQVDQWAIEKLLVSALVDKLTRLYNASEALVLDAMRLHAIDCHCMLHSQESIDYRSCVQLHPLPLLLRRLLLLLNGTGGAAAGRNNRQDSEAATA
jgi:hypothetical protein